ncbi:hypothetical protein HHL21_14570 [Massilia sp. RP-1-19]|uniref:Uncharacterized protein n=1 Tax=Massilia polaris TaxID=2728846 RepID=A0A848HUB3_9BURK|nr:hypothetical protein [Massilia polaris]NML62278.1 hypothetical protein [Massilia polaris]
MTRLMGRIASVAVPRWAMWAAVGVLAVSGYGTGRLHEARRGADAHAQYVAGQAEQVVVIVKKQTEVVTVVETKYRDRIHTIHTEGVAIESIIPDLITPADIERFAVNVGFVRLLDAGWDGSVAGPASDSDREPAGISLDEVAAVQVGNATSCRIWREQVYGWREFYAKQQVAVNGEAGEWYVAAPLIGPPQ